MEEVSSLTSRLDFQTLNISDPLPLYALSHVRTVIFTFCLTNVTTASACYLSFLLLSSPYFKSDTPSPIHIVCLDQAKSGTSAVRAED